MAPFRSGCRDAYNQYLTPAARQNLRITLGGTLLQVDHLNCLRTLANTRYSQYHLSATFYPLFVFCFVHCLLGVVASNFSSFELPASLIFRSLFFKWKPSEAVHLSDPDTGSLAYSWSYPLQGSMSNHILFDISSAATMAAPRARSNVVQDADAATRRRTCKSMFRAPEIPGSLR